MLRSLNTAATGMDSQQRLIDTLSNNMANVNTIGLKLVRLIFMICFTKTSEHQVYKLPQDY